jgi:hypothetical protein
MPTTARNSVCFPVGGEFDRLGIYIVRLTWLRPYMVPAPSLVGDSASATHCQFRLIFAFTIEQVTTLLPMRCLG